MEKMLVTLMLVTVMSVTSSLARSDFEDTKNHLVSASQVSSSQSQSGFEVCIDDSDCKKLGAKHACFQYICYPYEDDSGIRSDLRKKKCSKNEECGHNQACHRHHDRRHINTGLCMDKLGDCRENGERDCPDKCCNGQYCCESKYFSQLKTLPCINHNMCKDLGYGDYCCPVKGDNSTSVCCDTNPNPPPPTMAPKVDSLSGSGRLEAALLVITAVMSAAVTFNF